MRFGYSEDFCPWLYLKLHNVVSSYEIHDEFKRLPSPITCKTMLAPVTNQVAGQSAGCCCHDVCLEKNVP